MYVSSLYTLFTDEKRCEIVNNKHERIKTKSVYIFNHTAYRAGTSFIMEMYVYFDDNNMHCRTIVIFFIYRNRASSFCKSQFILKF